MIGLILLILSFGVGMFLTVKFLPFLKKKPYFWGVSFFLGVFWTGLSIFLSTFLFLETDDPLKWSVWLFVFLFCVFVFLSRGKLKKNFSFLVINVRLLLVWGIVFLFSFWFFSRTFSYQNDQILVASNVYLDFGAHVPLIRSFSLGRNFPPELPFYSGKPIFYHFLFDFTTAIFEKAGWSIALAYNLLSALSLSFLFWFLFYFSQDIFQKKSWVLGFLSSLFFILTPDLSFLQFFKKYGTNNFLTNLRNHNLYLNNGLVTDKFFGGFFNINVFTNQRHLVFGFGLFFIFILLLRRLPRNPFFAGIFLGLLPFWHNFVFLAVCLVWGFAWLINRKKIILKILLVAFLVALPQILFIRTQTENQIIFQPGFLIDDNLTLFNFFKFWFYNFGFGLPLLLLSWIFCPTKVKKFLLPFLILFVAPNLFHFAKEPFNDHKFFNLFSIFSGMLLAWFLVFWWQKKLVFKFFCLGFFGLIVVSGFLNLLVVKNDVWVSFFDIGQNSFLQWVEEKTEFEDIFLTNLEIWDPVNFSGRKKFLGRPHYLWAYGGDPSKRMLEKNEVLKGKNKVKIENILKDNEIRFLAFSEDGESVDIFFFEENFSKVYQDSKWQIYEVK